MLSQIKPPFRAEHIGSLLRPKVLLDQRAKFARGEIDQAALTQAEDQAIKDALVLQERVGLKFATDGEFRRRSYHSFFYRQLGDLSIDTVGGVDAQGGTPGKRASQPVAMIKSRVRWSHPINVPDFAFIHTNTKLIPKITIPGPCALHFRGGDAAVLAGAYTDLDQFWDDTVEAFGKELQALANAGCRYVQIDETAFAKFGDPEVQASLKARGDDWSALIDKYVAVTNRVLSNAPAGMQIGMHLCRGKPRRPVARRRQLRLGRRTAVQRAQHSILLPGIRLAAGRHVHAAAAGAAPQDRGAGPHFDQDPGDGEQGRVAKARRRCDPLSRSRLPRGQPAVRLRQPRHWQSDHPGGAGAEAPAGGGVGARHLGRGVSSMRKASPRAAVGSRPDADARPARRRAGAGRALAHPSSPADRGPRAPAAIRTCWRACWRKNSPTRSASRSSSRTCRAPAASSPPTWVAKSPPDGHVLMFGDSGAMAINPALNANLGYDPIKDFAPVTALVSLPTIMSANPTAPDTLAAFIALAKKEPGKMSYGSAGAGSIHHLTMAIFADRTGIDLLHVPYRGGSAMVNGLLTGEIQVGWSGIPNVMALIESGKLRGYCISVLQRSPSTPEIPTCDELRPQGLQRRHRDGIACAGGHFAEGGGAASGRGCDHDARAVDGGAHEAARHGDGRERHRGLRAVHEIRHGALRGGGEETQSSDQVSAI